VGKNIKDIRERSFLFRHLKMQRRLFKQISVPLSIALAMPYWQQNPTGNFYYRVYIRVQKDQPLKSLS
jgi:hypothetical protein